MTLSSNPLFRITLVGQVTGEKDTVNVFHYRATNSSSTVTLSEVLDAFESEDLPQIVNVIQNEWSVKRIVGDHLNGTDFEERSSIAIGQRAGQRIANYVTASFIYQRNENLLRNGYKRFSPVSEDDVGGQQVSASYEGVCNILATELGDSLIPTAPGGGAVNPCILRRAASYTPSYDFSGVADVKFQGIGSQVTRKVPFSL